MGSTVTAVVESGAHVHSGAMGGGVNVYFGGEIAHHGQPTAAVAGVVGSAPAAVVGDGDQQLVVVKLGLQVHHRVGVMHEVGVFGGVGQGFIDGQGEIVNQSGGKAEGLQPLLETHPQPARVVGIGLGHELERAVVLVDEFLPTFPGNRSTPRRGENGLSPSVVTAYPGERQP